MGNPSVDMLKRFRKMLKKRLTDVFESWVGGLQLGISPSIVHTKHPKAHPLVPLWYLVALIQLSHSTSVRNASVSEFE